MNIVKFLIFFYIFIIFSPPANAYIDPGTGSMLFSIILCSITSVLFLFNTLILKFKRGFLFKKKLSKNHHKFVIYSEGNQYYNVFKQIIDEFEKRETELMYFTSDENDLFFNEEHKYIKKEYIGKKSKAYFKLAFLNADICLLTIPQLDVLQLKRSKGVKHYSHILHSIGFSNDYRLFGLDYYDSVLCDAQFQIPLIKEIEQKRNLPAKDLEVIGSTYLDYNNCKIEKVEKDKFTVLIAPSWGEYGLLNKYGNKILKQLVNTDYKIIIRPHPQSVISDKKLIENLTKEFQNYPNIEWNYDSNNIKSLSEADILISDFSSILMDWAFLFKKPFLYFNTEVNFEMLDCADNGTLPPWRYHAMKQIGYELSEKKGDIEKIISIIENLKNDDNIKENIRKASEYAWENQGLAAKKAVDFLIKKQEELEEKC